MPIGYMWIIYDWLCIYNIYTMADTCAHTHISIIITAHKHFLLLHKRKQNNLYFTCLWLCQILYSWYYFHLHMWCHLWLPIPLAFVTFLFLPLLWSKHIAFTVIIFAIMALFHIVLYHFIFISGHLPGISGPFLDISNWF